MHFHVVKFVAVVALFSIYSPF